MSQRIDQFHQGLRIKLTNIESGLDSLKARIQGKPQHAEQDVRGHLEQVQRRIQKNQAKFAAAQAEMKSWAEDRKLATADKIAEWEARAETSKLQNRADKAERYAAAAMDVALETIDEAEQAAVEAWLARQDASGARSATKAAPTR